MTNPWLQSQIEDITSVPYAELTAEAHAECAKCRGREHGDCGGSFCWCFELTATEAEKEAASRPPVAKYKKKIKRGWVGAAYVEP